MNKLLTIFVCALMLIARAEARTGLSLSKSDTTKAKKLSLGLYMRVGDHISHEGVDSLKAVLLWAKDSTMADTVHVETYSYGDKRESFLSFDISQAGHYLVRIDADGYYRRYIDVDIPRLYRRETYRELKTVYLQRRRPMTGDETVEMQEVLVRPTKLKFYMDGDTLTYDADAFAMAEGSMLDALIKKLPGVEMKSGGEIWVNGRKVEALLLNGKDFFDKDRELLLENMPAFMVQSIQNFERTPENVKGTLREQTTPKELVMNIRLKRDYNQSWLASFEGGMGMRFHGHGDFKSGAEAPPFLARAYAMRYSNRSRFVLFANANNLTDFRPPGQQGDWSPLMQQQGLMSTYMVSGNGMIEKGEALRYEGSATGKLSDSNNAQHAASETFLSGGNTFGRSFSQQRSHNLDVSSNHSLRYRRSETLWNTLKGMTLELSPYVQYTRWRSRSESASATLAQDVAEGWGKAWMDSLASPSAGDLLLRHALNRTVPRMRGKGHYTGWGSHLFFTTSPAHNDMISFSLQGNYEQSLRHEDSYEHYLLEYPQTGNVDRRNRYRPVDEHSSELQLRPNITFSLNHNRNHQLSISHDYDRQDNKDDKLLYLLNQLKDWSAFDHHPLGTLPSTQEYLSTLDSENSYRQHNTTTVNSPELNYMYVNYNDSTDKLLLLSGVLSLPVRRERMDYWQGAQADTILHRHTVDLSATVDVYHSYNRVGRSLNASYTTSVSHPPLRNLLNIYNNSNPLYVSCGNTSLRPSRDHSIYGRFSQKFRRTLFNVSGSMDLTQNALATAVLYDKATGVQTVRPENINGNWGTNLSLGFNIPLERSEKLRLNHQTSHDYQHSVDLIGIAGQSLPQRSVVASHSINDELSLSWRPSDKMDFGAKADVHYQRSTSERADFTTLNVFDFDYGVTAQIELPWKLQLSTDLTMYSRRGYSEQTMNTNELVWNARLTRRFLKGNLLLAIDAFDLLGQLSNVRRTINAQGRTETYYNVIPSYGLLHLTWRMNKKPKH